MGAEDRATAGLVISELLTNAVLHGREVMTLAVTRAGRVLDISVTDHGRPGATTATCDPDEHGRGLSIVAAVAQDLRIEQAPQGWRVRVRMHLDHALPPDRADRPSQVRRRPAAAGHGQPTGQAHNAHPSTRPPEEGQPMSPRQITVLGECVADAFTEPASTPNELALRVLPGGGPANTAVALARLGTTARLLARLSDDVFGRLFRTHLEESNVDLSYAVAAAEPSTLAVAELDAHGQAAYSFHAQNTADWQWTSAELAGADLSGTSCLHTGSLALVQQPGAVAVEDLLARASAQVTISIDPNVRPLLVRTEVYRARLTRWCRLADVLRLSEDDLRLLLPGTLPEQACDIWHTAGARLVVITRGADGVLASLDGERVEVPAVATRIVDTVGAGDSFTAGLLHHLNAQGLLDGRLTDLRLNDVEDACRFAARVAALTCSVAGPNPPWQDQLEHLATADEA
ncbi:hypothetical protein GCM10010350_69620 [Streptomyces galilaeus]|nr:hypothetical protein GCM10010350_69620 [Streptomyces galilaeus]